MHPTVAKALAGETVTATDIQAMGGYEAFDTAVKVAQKPRKAPSPPPPAPRNWREERKDIHAQRDFAIGKGLFALLIIPFMLYGCVVGCHP